MIAKPSEDDLHAYVDGRLEPERRAEVAAQVAQDPEARARAEAYAAQRRLLLEALKAFPDGEPDPRTAILSEELARRLEARRAAVSSSRQGAPQGRRWRRPILAGALAACLAAGWFGRDLYGLAVAPAQPLPILAAADRTLPSLLAGRFDIPSLAPLGLHFVGGHVTDTRDGMLAYLVYENGGGQRTTVTISPYPYEGSMRPIVAEHGGVKLAHWRSNRMSYVLASTMADNQIEMAVAAINARMSQADAPAPR